MKGRGMNKADIPFLSATALGDLIQTLEVSPVEATEAYLERIDAIDGTLHSYITVCRQEALQAARAAEQALARGESRGPLHGVPYAVKDQFWTRGILTTGGSTILADFVPQEAPQVVARLNTAGAVLLGKLNMSELPLVTACAIPTARRTTRGTSGAIQAPPVAVLARLPQRFSVPPRW